MKLSPLCLGLFATALAIEPTMVGDENTSTTTISNLSPWRFRHGPNHTPGVHLASGVSTASAGNEKSFSPLTIVGQVVPTTVDAVALASAGSVASGDAVVARAISTTMVADEKSPAATTTPLPTAAWTDEFGAAVVNTAGLTGDARASTSAMVADEKSPAATTTPLPTAAATDEFGAALVNTSGYWGPVSASLPTTIANELAPAATTTPPPTIVWTDGFGAAGGPRTTFIFRRTIGEAWKHRLDEDHRRMSRHAAKTTAIHARDARRPPPRPTRAVFDRCQKAAGWPCVNSPGEFALEKRKSFQPPVENMNVTGLEAPGAEKVEESAGSTVHIDLDSEVTWQRVTCFVLVAAVMEFVLA